ncbi:MAG: histidine--tRNA ligase [Chloroflexota bacterium]|nr:histidine--tRNA ligase [Chloroflexota bacterium]
MSEASAAGKRVKAQVLSGFRDQLPAQMILRRMLIERFRAVFEAHGFEPIDTPALEYLEVLTGKAGENEKLMYHFTDHGGRDVGLRYDLTVPLARYVANHQNELPLPFKRYHIAPVWRAEKAQRGRFREFYQCDADIVGSPSTTADAEAISMVGEILAAAGLPEFSVSISHRQLLAGIARVSGISSDLASVVYRTVDKLHKIGSDAVRQELVDAGASEDAASRLLEQITHRGSNEELIERIRHLAANEPELSEALDQLGELFSLLESLAPESDCFRLDLTLARGLDYYTGIVYEATVDKPRIGSVSGGGRYDGLVGSFAGRHIPAVGISIGLERILEVANEFNLVEAPSSVADVIVIYSEDALSYAAGIARQLRQEGLNTDLSLMARRSFGDQLKYTERRGIPIAVIAGGAERDSAVANIKVLATGEQVTVPLGATAREVRARIVAR